MEIILTQKVERLGQLGEVVNVKRGYAKNFLFPQGKAIRASKENIAKFQADKNELEKTNLKLKKDAEIQGEQIKGSSIVIIRSASETGQLFGSVSKRDISNSLNNLGHKVNHQLVILERTIKDLGLYEIILRLHPEVDIKINLNIARSEEEAKIQTKTGSSIIKEEKISSDETDKTNKAIISSETISNNTTASDETHSNNKTNIETADKSLEKDN